MIREIGPEPNEGNCIIIKFWTGQCIYCTDPPEWFTFHSSQKTFHGNKIVLILQADYNKMTGLYAI